MKTIEIQLYKFDELSQESKQKAISNHTVESDYIYTDVQKTIKAFCELFGIKQHGRTIYDFSTNFVDPSILNMKGQRLRTWILNNFWEELYTRKFYGSIGDNKIIKHPCIKVNRYDMSKGARVNSSNFYYSRIQRQFSCPLTGVCYDHSILKPIEDFINWSDPEECKSITFEDLIADCFHCIQKDVESEEEYLHSDEAITEHLTLNNYEFTGDGIVF